MPIESDIIGKWNLVESENFDEYMKEVGVGFMTRKVAGNLKPQLEFVVNGDEWQWTSVSTFKTHVVKFKLGAEFDEKTADGRDVSSVYTIEGDKLIQQEKGKNGGKNSTLERVIKDGKLVITCTSGPVTCVRTYARA